MDMSHVHAARESARQTDGRFGVQPRDEAATILAATPTLRDEPLTEGQIKRRAFDGNTEIGHVLYTLHDGETGHMDEMVEVDSLWTDPAYRGRGTARTLLASLRADHPGFGFTTDRFDSPIARRAWDEVLGDASFMTADGDTECAWCSGPLFYDDETEENELCSTCDANRTGHESGTHTEPASDCWFCDAERGSRAKVA